MGVTATLGKADEQVVEAVRESNENSGQSWPEVTAKDWRTEAETEGI